MKKPECVIEHHATLFALLAKYSIEICGEEGKNAVIEAVACYGRERGERMRKRAVKNGDELSLMTSIAYGEWRPKAGQMENAIIQTEPTYITTATKCAWCDSWKKHDLLEYGKYYCVNIDDAVYSGFCPDFSVDIKSTLSWEAGRCEFDWGFPLTEHDLEELGKKRELLGSSCTENFIYHTAHLFDTVSRELIEHLGENGSRAVEMAKTDFVEKFGIEYFNAIKSFPPNN